MNTKPLPDDAPSEPGSFKFLKIVHLVICGLGIVWCLLFLLGVIVDALTGGDAGGDAEAEAMIAPMITPMILWGIIGLGVLVVHCLASWKMLRRNRSFRLWNNIYGISSLGSKVIYFVLGLFLISKIVNTAESEVAKENPLGYALSGEVVDAEMSELSMQYTLVLIGFLIVTAIYPVVTLLLNNLRPIAGYSAALTHAAATAQSLRSKNEVQGQ